MLFVQSFNSSHLLKASLIIMLLISSQFISGCSDNEIKGKSFNELKSSIYDLSSQLEEKERLMFIKSISAIIRSKTKNITGEPDINTIMYLNSKTPSHIVSEWKSIEKSILDEEKSLKLELSALKETIKEVEEQILFETDYEKLPELAVKLEKIKLLQKELVSDTDTFNESKKNRDFHEKVMVMTREAIPTQQNLLRLISKLDQAYVDKVTEEELSDIDELSDKLIKTPYDDFKPLLKLYKPRYMTDLTSDTKSQEDKFRSYIEEMKYHFTYFVYEDKKANIFSKKVKQIKTEIAVKKEDILNFRAARIIPLREKQSSLNKTLQIKFNQSLKLKSKHELLKLPISGI